MEKSFTFSAIARLLQGQVLNAPKDDVLLSSPVFKSRDATKDSIFIAIKGAKENGHTYIDDAYGNGSKAFVVSDSSALNGHPGIVVADTRLSLSKLADLFAGHPSKELKVVGITGTNGKTTTNWMLYSLFNRLGDAALRIGTLGMACEGLFDMPADLTTPDSLELHGAMRSALNFGAKACVMEVSSHALSQQRVADVKFDVGVFTNLTRDHLDYHRDMQEYFEAKEKLFELVCLSAKGRKAVVNLDDPYGVRLAESLKQRSFEIFGFGETKNADVLILSFAQHLCGSKVSLRAHGIEYSIDTPLVGLHNAKNIATAFATLLALGYEPDDFVPHFSYIPQVPGRLESIGNENLGVFVDYAHTPDALKNVLVCLRALVKNKLWVVFGCGGDRDKGKRSEMGKIASEFADKVVVTSDNPRSEDPNQIIVDILRSGVKPAFVEVDRRHAINKVLGAAAQGDIVLIAGKGHENYQIIGSEKFHFSDVEEVRKASQVL